MEHIHTQVVTVYGQTEVTKDLYDAQQSDGYALYDDVPDVQITALDTQWPQVLATIQGQPTTVHCDWVVGCDGFHGVSRQTIPASKRQEFERVYPFGWLGVLSPTPPVSHELIYASHDAGFALCSMRSEQLSRYYVQCPLDTDLNDWSDDAFWARLKSQLPPAVAANLVSAATLEKSIAPLRSFVCEPMQYQRLFLVGDAAHIVPPTGAKGLNLAFSDVHYLQIAFAQFYQQQDDSGLLGYSAQALSRVWKAERFSWWMTQLLHRFEDASSFQEKMRHAEFEYLVSSPHQQAALAENYVGLPF